MSRDVERLENHEGTPTPFDKKKTDLSFSEEHQTEKSRIEEIDSQAVGKKSKMKEKMTPQSNNEVNEWQLNIYQQHGFLFIGVADGRGKSRKKP